MSQLGSNERANIGTAIGDGDSAAHVLELALEVLTEVARVCRCPKRRGAIALGHAHFTARGRGRYSRATEARGDAIQESLSLHRTVLSSLLPMAQRHPTPVGQLSAPPSTCRGHPDWTGRPDPVW